LLQAEDVRTSPVAQVRASRVGQGLLLASPVVVLAAMAWSRRWICDDGFIHLRVVRQILSGNGPVFNGGERVEASTSPLWVFVLTMADLVAPVRLEWIAVGVGIGLTLAGLWWAMAGSRALFATTTDKPLFVPVGAAVLVAVSPVWTFSSSGLEGGLAYAWLGFCLWALARWARRYSAIGSVTAVVLGLGVLIRPELAVFTLLFAIVLLLGGRDTDTRADRVGTLGLMAAVPVLYQLFRMGYYAALAPQPAAAKEASWAWWDKGWDYLRAFADPYWLWVPALVLLVGAYLPQAVALKQAQRWRALLVVASFALGAVVDAVYIVRVGGDFMYARLLLPSLFAFVAPVAVVPFCTRYVAALLVLPWVGASLVFLRSPADNPRQFGTGRRNVVTVEDFGWGEGQPGRAWFTGDGIYFLTTRLDGDPARSERDPAVAAYGIGIVGYALGADVYVLDLIGLADPFTAHLKLERRGLVAHEKPLPAPWTVARLLAPGADVGEADFPLPTVFGARRIDSPRGVSFDERVRVARAALRCSSLRRFQASYTAPLSLDRFLSNMRHAVSYWRLRIPPEPADAYARFCREARE
jgi:arabinofuranosyltransferase